MKFKLFMSCVKARKWQIIEFIIIFLVIFYAEIVLCQNVIDFISKN